MASVFLSYDHDDAAHARTIALALEKAGYSVWWDLHVRGGMQFSKAIEEALKSADVVVVLWSEQSVESPWVRDEATSGRDRGRLVPIALDNVEPPLGFRQFQTIDLSTWKGRGNVPRFSEILQSIDGAAGEEVERSDPITVRRSMPALSDISGPIRLALLAGLALTLIAGAYFRVYRSGTSDLPTVAIVAADPAAQGLSQDLLGTMGNLRSVQTGSVQLVGEAGQNRPALIFETRAPGLYRDASLTLMDGEDRALLWSKEFEEKSGNPADLKLKMTFSAGRVLGCALEGLNPGGKALNKQTLKLYLVGCSQYEEANDENRTSVVLIFEQVVKDAPRFKAAWAKLLLAESEALLEDSGRGRANLRKYIEEARKLDPQMPEATVAEVTLLPGRAFGEALRLLDRAIESHPGNPLVASYRSFALANVGRMNEAIEDAKKATELDPTSQDTLNNYVLVLAYSGRVDAARAELQRAARLWSGTGRFEELQHAFQLRFGDPKELLTTEAFKAANPRMQLYYRTRADPSPANVDRFIAFMRELYSRRGLTANDIVGHSQPYGEFHREDVLYELISRLPANEDLSKLSGVIFRPSLRKFREDPRFMTVAKRIGLVDYWTRSGKWPDFCFDPDQPYDCKTEAAKVG